MKFYKKLQILGGIFLLSFCSKAQILSEKAQISIITCDAGNEIYSLFGHSAIRVKDDQKNIDEIYNYGTFNGFEENFELKFAKGQLMYSLSKQTIDGFLYEYQYYNRSVREQILNVPQDKKQEIYNFLLNNNLPENREYKYDFFYDNCATRLRDILEVILEDDLIFGKHRWHNEFSFREIIAKDLQRVPLTQFGIDLVLGQRIDIIASSYDLMFHPIYLEEVLSKTTYKGQALVSEPQVVFQAEEIESFQKDNSLLYIIWSIFILGALITMFKVDGLGKTLDVFIFYIIGITGIVLILMWFATDHPTTKFNWNILWMNPLLFLFPFMLKRKSLQYFKLMTFLYFGIFISWYILPQSFSSLTIPLILYLALRHFYHFRRINYKA